MPWNRNRILSHTRFPESRRRFLARSLLSSLAAWLAREETSASQQETMPNAFDLVIVGSTPAGLCAGIAAARLGSRVLLLERTDHIGGLPANGLGATDISTRGATGGLFLEFV